MRYIAPAGTPVTLLDLVSGLGSGLVGGRSTEELREALTKVSGQPRCWPIASGRAAMTLTLQAMVRACAAPHRREVLIPGYTCYSVPAAIERAGLKVRLCDVDPNTLGIDPDGLRRTDFRNVLAVVTANLYGVPNALADIETIARDQGIFMLDDAAQSLGARLGNRAVGGFGDAGLYSFDKGKNITTLQGGAIVAARAPLANTIEELWGALPQSAASQTSAYALKLALYSVLLRPGLYGLVQRIPGLGLGKTMYETRYPVARFSGVLAGLAVRLAGRLDQINRVRVTNAGRIEAALQGARGIRIPQRYDGAAPVFARYPLRVERAEQRDELITNLNRAGIGATASYPQALIDVPEVARALDHPADQSSSRLVARTIVTIPTHAYCPADIGHRVRAIVDRTLQ